MGAGARQRRTLPGLVLLTAIRQEDKSLLHAVLHDITEQKKGHQEIEFPAFHDELTGLPNRVLGRERLQRALESAAGSKTGLALLHVSPHRLSAINEAYGQRGWRSPAAERGHPARPVAQTAGHDQPARR